MNNIPDPTSSIVSGYVLIDTLNFPRTLSSDPLPILRCVPAELTNIADLLPGLIDLTAINTSQIDEIRDILTMQAAGEHAWSICALLTCDQGVEELSAHLSRFLSGRDADGNPVLWRYFDPRVLSVVISIFGETQLAALLGPIRELRFNWCGHWWSVTASADRSNKMLDSELAWPDKDQWQVLKLSSLIHRVLSLLSRDQTIAPAECLQMQNSVISRLRQAELEWHLTDPEDRIEFAYMGVKYGSAFLQHPELRQARVELINGRRSWTSIRSAFTAKILNELAKPMYR